MRRCSECANFESDGAVVEAAFPGLSALSSGYASVRGQDGLCTLRDIYLPGSDGCSSFIPVAASVDGDRRSMASYFPLMD